MSPLHFPMGSEGLAGRRQFEAADTRWLDGGGARVLLADVPDEGVYGSQRVRVIATDERLANLVCAGGDQRRKMRASRPPVWSCGSLSWPGHRSDLDTFRIT